MIQGMEGAGQALTEKGGSLEWIHVKPRAFVHIPGGTKHAHRNTSTEPLVELITTTVS